MNSNIAVLRTLRPHTRFEPMTWAIWVLHYSPMREDQYAVVISVLGHDPIYNPRPALRPLLERLRPFHHVQVARFREPARHLRKPRLGTSSHLRPENTPNF